MLRIFRARICNFPNADNALDFPNGFIAIDLQGKIVDYGNWDKRKARQYQKYPTYDYTDYIILPAFIDMHLHLPQFHLRGHYGVSLLDWLKEYIIPAENTLSIPEKTESFIKAFFQEMWRSGTTTALIFSSNSKQFTDQAFAVAKQIGFRAIIGKVMTDHKFSNLKMPIEPTQKSIRESIELYEKWHGHGGHLYYAFSPRFAPACSESLLKEVGKFAYQHNAYIHTHLAETIDEIKLVKKLFPKYKTYTELYYKTGILSERTIVAHAIHLQDSEFTLLAKTHTKVAHCPSSNFFLHSGLANTQKMEDYGIEIGLGSDIGAGPSFSLFTIMRDAYYVRSMAPAKAFYYATLGAAKALKLDDRIGSFEKGKDADFVIVKYPYWCNKDVSRTRLLSQLMFRGDDHLTIETYTRGQKVYQKIG